MPSIIHPYNRYKILDAKTGEYVRDATREEIDAQWIALHTQPKSRDGYHKNAPGIDLGNGRKGNIFAYDDSGRHELEVPCGCGATEGLCPKCWSSHLNIEETNRLKRLVCAECGTVYGG